MNDRFRGIAWTKLQVQNDWNCRNVPTLSLSVPKQISSRDCHSWISIVSPLLTPDHKMTSVVALHDVRTPPRCLKPPFLVLCYSLPWSSMCHKCADDPVQIDWTVSHPRDNVHCAAAAWARDRLPLGPGGRGAEPANEVVPRNTVAGACPSLDHREGSGGGEWTPDIGHWRDFRHPSPPRGPQLPTRCARHERRWMAAVPAGGANRPVTPAGAA